MAVQAKRLVSGSLLTGSAATYYTASNVTTRIDKMTATNTDTSARTITVYLVPNAGTAGDSNIIIDAKSILPGETYTCPEGVGHVVQNGGTIQALASTAGVVSFMSSGVEIT
jgi:hypothetical protein